MKLNGNLDAADLVKAIADTASSNDEREMAAYMFMREIEEIIDERVAMALEKRFPVTVATAPVEVSGVVYRTREDGAAGMLDPRS